VTSFGPSGRPPGIQILVAWPPNRVGLKCFGSAHANASKTLVIATHAGDYLQSSRLSGASFESADDATPSNWQ
jgi:hypothetical protein